jgi:hypothetical protein
MRVAVPMLLAIAVIAGPVPSRAQILRDLPALDLRYDIYHGEPAVKVGSATVSFQPEDTRRGRRLLVKSKIQYTIQRPKPKDQVPFSYEEEATLVCDKEGVVRFDTVARALGEERVNVAVRVRKNYELTTTFQGKKHTKTITSGVQRTNFGLFAAGYLAVPLDQGDMFEDFPLLYPVGGDHQARQKFREAVMPVAVAPHKQVSAIVTRLAKPDKTSDRLWNTASEPEILLRMEETSNLGMMTYRLVSVNGVSLENSELIR